MPWREYSVMSRRRELVMFASDNSNISHLSRRYDISRKTAYKWIKRYIHEGEEGLSDRSRRPHRSPLKVSEQIEDAVLAVREDHSTWGGRKIRARLIAIGYDDVPSASTITAILHRNGKISTEESDKHRSWKSFEYEEPNDLWQIDFKGHFSLRNGRCHPLTILDDHLRFSVGLRACTDEKRTTVHSELENLFNTYGLPERILFDNGSPWGGRSRRDYTRLAVWLIRLGISVIHSRAYHPQTLGKEERFHRTLKAELLSGREFSDIDQLQASFDSWRECYNFERPHEALNMATPAQRYRPSRKEMPKSLPKIEYGPDDHVRKVQANGEIYFRGREFKVGHAFRGEPVAVRPTMIDGQYKVFYCGEMIKKIDLNIVDKIKWKV